MKKICCYILVLSLALSAITACEKTDRTYKDFVVPGGLTYVGKANSPIAHTGRNRIKISWLRGADPNIANAKIFWNNFNDSVEVAIPSNGDTISYIINNLPEKNYNFVIKTYDNKGHSSVPVEIFSASYGDVYQESLLSRPVNESILYSDSLSIIWGGADISNGAYATDVKYTDTLGKEQVKRFAANLPTSTLTDLKSGTKYMTRTVYLPDSSSIDTFYTSFVESKTSSLSQKDWKIIDFSTQHPGDENLVTHMIDGKPDTRWHSWVGNSSYPHFFTVDMGLFRNISAFKLYRRSGDDRGCNTFKMQVSEDNVTWTDVGTFNFNRTIDEGQTYEIPSQPRARYFKFIGLTGSQEYIVMGEIYAYGS
jgi:hypothetical protein